MRISIDQLKNEYLLDEVLTHKDPMPFFKKYLNKLTPWYVLYTIFLIIAVFSFVFTTLSSEFSIFFLSALAFTMTIVLPLHELIHALFYKINGAKNIKFKVNLKQFVVYTMADKDIITFKVLNVIAVAPAIFFTLLFLILSLVFYNSIWGGFFAFTNLIHISLCGGDLSLLNYSWKNRKVNGYTYDDLDSQESYFYITKI